MSKKQLIGIGNQKMGPQVMTFSLPAVKTCKPSKWCLEGKNGKPRCYALRGRLTWHNVVAACERRYEASKQDDFVDRMVGEIKKAHRPYFRIHVSGDFYSPQYVEKWIEIAKRCPEVLFRTTTRRWDFVGPIQRLNRLPNVSVRESVDPSRPRGVMDLRLAAAGVYDHRRKAIMCPDDCEKCGHKCWWETDKDEVFEEY